jgi:hypothetical protein
MSKDKYFANRGVERNKTPLKNIVYEFRLSQLKEGQDPEKYEEFKFKDLGYISYDYWYEEKKPIIYWGGFITIDNLKHLIGTTQYSKFCQGKRLFIIQRRIGGKNVKKVSK